MFLPIACPIIRPPTKPPAQELKTPFHISPTIFEKAYDAMFAVVSTTPTMPALSASLQTCEVSKRAAFIAVFDDGHKA